MLLITLLTLFVLAVVLGYIGVLAFQVATGHGGAAPRPAEPHKRIVAGLKQATQEISAILGLGDD